MLIVDKQKYLPYVPLDCPVSGKRILVNISKLVHLSDEKAVWWPCGSCNSWHVVTEPSKYFWIMATVVKS